MGQSSYNWVERGQQAFLDATLDESDDQTIKDSSGVLIDMVIHNPSADTAVYVKLLDAATFDVSADTPTHAFGVPAASTLVLDFTSCPIQFKTAISIAAAQEAGAGATAPDSDPVVSARYA